MRCGISISSPTACSSGVPQGSVLGPLLFLLYTRCIPEILPESVKCQLFADDILIYCSGKSPSRLPTSLSDAVTTLKTWLDGRGLCLNVDNTKAMFLPPATCLIPADIAIECSNIPLSIASSYKYLGLIIDSTLTWDAHIDSVVRKRFKEHWCTEKCGKCDDQRHKAEILLSSGAICLLPASLK